MRGVPMGWFSKLIGAGDTAKVIPDTVNAVAGVSDSIMGGLDDLFTSDDERLAWAAKREEVRLGVESAIANKIHELNLINASDPRFFNSGWRPAIGWVLAISISCYFIPRFLIASAAWGYACWVYVREWAATCTGEAVIGCVRPALNLPDYPVDDSGLWQLAGMMLIGVTYRSWEKLNGVAAK